MTAACSAGAQTHRFLSSLFSCTAMWKVFVLCVHTGTLEQNSCLGQPWQFHGQTPDMFWDPSVVPSPAPDMLWVWLVWGWSGPSNACHGETVSTWAFIRKNSTLQQGQRYSVNSPTYVANSHVPQYHTHDSKIMPCSGIPALWQQEASVVKLCCKLYCAPFILSWDMSHNQL